MGSEWDLSSKLAFAGVVMAVLVPVALLYVPSHKDYEDWLAHNPAFRQQTLARLQANQWTILYRDWLSRALGWLDRHWGRPGSAQALGVCIVIALCYGWIAFFLGYALGAPGSLGKVEWLPDLSFSARSAAALAAIVGPALIFLMCHWLGARVDGLERAWRHGSLRAGRRSAKKPSWRRLAWINRAKNGLLASGLLLVIIVTVPSAGGDSLLVIPAVCAFFASTFCVSPAIGLVAAGRQRRDWLKGLFAAFTGGVACIGVTAGSFAETLGIVGAIAGALTGAFAAALIGVITGAEAIRLVTAGAEAGALELTSLALGLALLAALLASLVLVSLPVKSASGSQSSWLPSFWP